MKKVLTLIVIVFIFFGGCEMKDQKDKWIEEIKENEKAFTDMVAKEGMHKAFIAFAADDAVLLRSEKLIIGKPAIDQFYEGVNSTTLTWKPDYIDVAESGDLAYTYGYYSYIYTDKDGKEQQSQGVFHTIWKRQKDGKWKFVWD